MIYRRASPQPVFWPDMPGLSDVPDEQLREELRGFYFPSGEEVKPRSDDVAQMVSRILAEMAAQREEQ